MRRVGGACEVILADLLQRAATATPHMIAVDIVDGRGRTYGELQSDVMAFAAALAKRGVGRGDRVALLGSGSPEFIASLHGAAWIGAVAVPIDIRSTAPEIAAIIDDCDPAIVYAEARFTGLLDSARRACGSSPSFETFDGLPAFDRRTPPTAGDDDVAMILYTSGTTGAPKGVCLSHRAVIWNGVTICIAQRLKRDDVFLAVTPLSHAGSATRVFTALVTGQRLAVTTAFDAERFPRLVAEHGVTTTILVPTMMRDVLDAHPDERLGGLRSVIYGAAPSTLAIIEEALDRWDCGLFHAYGLSEATTNVAILPPEEHVAELLGSVGHPLPGVLLEVRDDSGEQITSGDVGDVWVRSDKVMSGYWRRPGETAAVFSKGWLKSGDLGRFDPSGHLWLAGRRKELIIVGGNNVYPAEVEAVLRANPTVADAAVVGGPHDRLGEVPIGFVITTEGARLDPEALVAWATDRLAPFKVPRTIVELDAFPRTSSGKVSTRELARRAAEFGSRP